MKGSTGWAMPGFGADNWLEQPEAQLAIAKAVSSLKFLVWNMINSPQSYSIFTVPRHTTRF
jgi:hypothetical protein